MTPEQIKADSREIVITGKWDGELIWRRRTAAELMAKAYEEMERNRARREGRAL